MVSGIIIDVSRRFVTTDLIYKGIMPYILDSLSIIGRLPVTTDLIYKGIMPTHLSAK